ncbi:acyl carrier protein [Candidatus Poribacteria bacterium]|nr:acyl carrier protein [Candidatus Poribacteria bacterium]
MTESEIRRRVKEVIAGVSGIDIMEIGDNASFEEDLELDSLALLEISVDIELRFKEFNIQIPDDEIAELQTVQDAVLKVHEFLI